MPLSVSKNMKVFSIFSMDSRRRLLLGVFIKIPFIPTVVVKLVVVFGFAEVVYYVCIKNTTVVLIKGERRYEKE